MAVKKISDAVLETVRAPSGETANGTVTSSGRVRKGTVQITRTVLKQANGETLSVIFESVFTQAPPMMKRGKEMIDDDKKPPMIADVEDFETGIKHLLIGNTVLMSELNAKFPDGSYVGRAFDITPEKGSKEYRTYTIAEILFEQG